MPGPLPYLERREKMVEELRGFIQRWLELGAPDWQIAQRLHEQATELERR